MMPSAAARPPSAEPDPVERRLCLAYLGLSILYVAIRVGLAG